MRYGLLAGALLLATAWVGATMAGDSNAVTRYFSVCVDNAEYAPDGERRPTRAERTAEVRGHWQHFLQAYRAVEADPALRKKLAADRPRLDSGNGYDDLRALGITDTAIRAQSTQVYTLQLAALTRTANLHALLRRIRGKSDDGDLFSGTDIYRRTPKNLTLGYCDDSAAYKDDPVYVVPCGEITQVRYGIYASAEDAARDAVVWRTRFDITPWVTTIEFSDALVSNVLWGPLPGVWSPQ